MSMEFAARTGDKMIRFHCSVCEREESRCECVRYCCLCNGADNVRLCEDGLYYCMACREACDFQAQF